MFKFLWKTTYVFACFSTSLKHMKTNWLKIQFSVVIPVHKNSLVTKLTINTKKTNTTNWIIPTIAGNEWNFFFREVDIKFMIFSSDFSKCHVYYKEQHVCSKRGKTSNIRYACNRCVSKDFLFVVISRNFWKLIIFFCFFRIKLLLQEADWKNISIQFI